MWFRRVGCKRSPFHRKPAIAIATGITIFFAAQSYAGVATDGTLGPARSLTGPDFRIGQELGTTVGTNLFHSFERFSINSGESATFTGSDTLDNVISRVTGGSLSTIDGRLRSEVGTADFYFINPSGVVFGPNAKVDVPAAIHVGTADEVRFAGGSVFSATTPGASTLTAETPESFGYLGSRSASIVINGSQLDFAPGSFVSLSGGDVTVQGSETEFARITVPGGELRVFAAGTEAAEVSLAGELPSGSGTFQTTRAIIETSGDGGGQLLIGAGNATVNRAALAADNTGEADAVGLVAETGTVTIRVADFLEVLNGGQISSYAFGSGDAGGVVIQTGNLKIDSGRISSDAAPMSTGNAGTTTIKVTDLMEVLNGGQISSSTFAAGDAGGVKIEAGSLRIDSQGANAVSGIFGSAEPGSSGKAGMVTVIVSDLLKVLNGGVILSSTYAAGDAGGVKIEAGGVCIDGRGAQSAGIISQAVSGSMGNAGTVVIRVADLLEVLNGGQISSSTYGAGDGGDIEAVAGSLRIDGQVANTGTGINSGAGPGSKGIAGRVTIRVADLIEVLNGGQIWSSTFAVGDAGEVVIETGKLHIDRQGSGNLTGIASGAEPNSSGNAGTVVIRVADLLEVLNDGQISSSTYAAGNGGDVEIEAGSLRVDGREARYAVIGSQTQSSSSGNAGVVTITVADLLEILNGGIIASNTFGSGDAGGVVIRAGSLKNDYGRISSDAAPMSTGNAGTTTIKVTDLMEVLNGGQISSSTFAAGDAGGVKIEAGSLRIDSQGANAVSGIFGSAEPGSSGKAGMVTVIVSDLLKVLNGGVILSSTYAAGDAGGVKIEAGGVCIDGRGAQSTGIVSQSVSGSSGNAGTVVIKVADLLEVLNGGQISSSTFGDGSAGGVQVEAGSLRIDAQGAAGGTGINSGAAPSSLGQAGMIMIKVADLMEVLNGGQILSSAFAVGDAGSVEIEAGSLLVDDQGSNKITVIRSSAEPNSSGNSGMVTIRIVDLLKVLNGGQISSSTFATGDGGDVEIEAGKLCIDGQGSHDLTEIASKAEPGSSGNAGIVTIRVVNLLEVLHGGQISSSTFAEGDAGSVKIHTGDLLIDGTGSLGVTNIASAAGESALGFAGDVEIEAGKMTVQNGGGVTVQTHQIVSEDKLLQAATSSRLLIHSPLVILDMGAITAHSTGNVPAAAIRIDADKILIFDNSWIATSANEADGGTITLQGDIIDLRDSLITSSVMGQTGNGGDITLKGNSPAKVLIMEGGFIQANAPAGAKGGDIYIDTEAVIPGSGILEIGGLTRQSFEAGSGKNIIQAAAPGGEQGAIQITSPELDISGSLVSLSAALTEPIRLAADPCLFSGSAEASSLVLVGTGGVSAGPQQHAGLFYEAERFERVMMPDADWNRPAGQ